MRKIEEEVKDWIEFKKYRQGLLEKWYSSEAYCEIEKRRTEIYRKLTTENAIVYHAGLVGLNVAEKCSKPFIPEETYEAFLNWKADQLEGKK